MTALGLVVGGIAVAVLLGLAAGALSTTGALALAVIGLAAIGGLLFRRTMSTSPPRDAAVTWPNLLRFLHNI